MALSAHGFAAAATTDPDNVKALPTWELVSLLVLVALVIVGMFALTLYNLSAPRSTLKNILGLKGHGLLRRRDPKGKPLDQLALDPKLVNAKVLDSLGNAARVGKRTTRTTLAITGFSLLAILLVAVFGLSGPGVRDIRSQVVASVTTLAAAIAGFYFGSESGGRSTSGDGAAPAASAPTIDAPDDGSAATFAVGQPGSYRPTVTGSPAPTVTLTAGALPDGLALDAKTGAITGTPGPGTAATYPITLTASNGQSPDATLTVSVVVVAE